MVSFFNTGVMADRFRVERRFKRDTEKRHEGPKGGTEKKSTTVRLQNGETKRLMK